MQQPVDMVCKVCT